MGRGKEASAPPAPAFRPGEIRYGNQIVGKTFIDPKTKAIVSQYFPDPAEEERKKLTQERINQIMPTLGITAPELLAQYNQTETAFVDDSKKKFMEQYDPTLRELREDVAARFGTLNSSQFIDDLGKLENTKASALSDIINRGKMLKYDLTNQEEARKLRALQGLGAMLNSDQMNYLDSIQQPLDNSAVLNSYLNNQWMTQLTDFRQDLLNNRMIQAASKKNEKPWYQKRGIDFF